MKRRSDLATLAIGLSVDGDGVVRGPDDLPVAFRLFRAGENETTKGTFMFDAECARQVMATAEAYGNDFAIDLEHLSLDQEAPNYDPDARGYFNLEMRDGELWAVNVRWTPDGVRRLTEKTQRYISPAFPRNSEGRVTELVNIALVAQPATYSTPALVAANTRGKQMNARDRLSARLSIAKGKIQKLADAPPADGEAPAPGKFAQVQEAAKAAADAIGALESVKGVDDGMDAMAAAIAAMDTLENAIKALTGAGPDADAAPAGDPAQMSAPPTDPAEDPRKMSRAERVELAELRAFKAKVLEDTEVQRLAAERSERTSLETELVRLGRETPASVKDLADMPIEKLRSRVERFRGGPPANLGPVPPPSAGEATDGSKTFSTPFGAVTLTANQLRECERAGAKPEALAETLARRTGAKR